MLLLQSLSLFTVRSQILKSVLSKLANVRNADAVNKLGLLEVLKLALAFLMIILAPKISVAYSILSTATTNVGAAECS